MHSGWLLQGRNPFTTAATMPAVKTAAMDKTDPDMAAGLGLGRGREGGRYGNEGAATILKGRTGETGICGDRGMNNAAC